MLRIDSHNHFWKFDAARDSWITDEMSIIRRDFFPADLHAEMMAADITGCIAVQADQSEAQNDFLLLLAKENDFIKGIVGWVDLQSDNIEERLSFYAGEKKIKGFRHVLQGEENRALMLTPAFKNGISKLKDFNFTYDILIFPDQLPFLPQFLQEHPGQKFVIDHVAKPDIRNDKINGWKKDIERVAQQPNACCKVSGMVTEADWKTWELPHLVPYLDVVWEAFGADRVMFGSDWPVCLLASSYRRWADTMKEYTASFSNDEKDNFGAAMRVHFITWQTMSNTMKTLICTTPGSFEYGSATMPVLQKNHAIIRIKTSASAAPICTRLKAHSLSLLIPVFGS